MPTAADGIRLRIRVLDLARVRRDGTAEEKVALARRIFDVWQPIFSHLDGRDYRFHLEKHVNDHSAVQIRAAFGIDSEGRDRALVIVRVHEHAIAGRTWARLTVNAGVDPMLVQRHFGQLFLLGEVWRYRLRYPLRPFYVVDCAVSAASYCIYAKTFFGVAPAPDRPIPEAWWPLGEIGASALGGTAVAGAPREVRRFGLTVRDTSPRRPPSARARRQAGYFEAQTGGAPGLGILVMAPLDLWTWSCTSCAYLLSRLSGRLVRRTK